MCVLCVRGVSSNAHLHVRLQCQKCLFPAQAGLSLAINLFVCLHDRILMGVAESVLSLAINGFVYIVPESMNVFVCQVVFEGWFRTLPPQMTVQCVGGKREGFRSQNGLYMYVKLILQTVPNVRILVATT